MAVLGLFEKTATLHSVRKIPLIGLPPLHFSGWSPTGCTSRLVYMLDLAHRSDNDKKISKIDSCSFLYFKIKIIYSFSIYCNHFLRRYDHRDELLYTI